MCHQTCIDRSTCLMDVSVFLSVGKNILESGHWTKTQTVRVSSSFTCWWALTAVFHVQQPRHSIASGGVSRSGFSKSGFAKGAVKQGHLCYAVHSLLLLYCASLADECIFSRTWDLMKGGNIHRHSSLSLPWCFCFLFLSHFKVLNLFPHIRVCHSLLCQHTKQTDKLLPQKKEKKLYFSFSALGCQRKAAVISQLSSYGLFLFLLGLSVLLLIGGPTQDADWTDKSNWRTPCHCSQPRLSTLSRVVLWALQLTMSPKCFRT